MTALVIFGSFAIFLVLQVPIGFSLGLASMCAIMFSGVTQYKHLAQSMISALDSFPLMAVPFFILAGDLMGTGGISRRLLQVASLICGSLTGGLGLVTVAACMFFAAISGSGPATVAAIGGLMIPAMLGANYGKGFASGLIATAGSIGVIIPPSIPMVIYCVSTNTSVGTLFIAGVVPGLLIGFALMGLTYFIAKKRGLKGEVSQHTGKQKVAIVVEAFWALLIPFIILGGIYGQVFTPTEAAAVAVIYGAFVGVFIYKDLALKDLPKILARSALTSATVMVILGTASTFGRILTLEHIPTTLATAMLDFSSNPVVIILLIQLLLLIVGCFMETLAAIIILAPILFPIITKIGMDPIHFGLLMVVNLAIGFITPPLGVNLFVTCGIAKISLEDISKAILPWVFLMMVLLMLLTFVPSISLALPRLLGLM